MSAENYYKYGYLEGKHSAQITDWEKGELERVYRQDRFGEIARQILENWCQYAGTLYYDPDVSDEDIKKFEEGFYAGFEEEGKIMYQKGG